MYWILRRGMEGKSGLGVISGGKVLGNAMKEETPLFCNMQAMSKMERRRYDHLRERLQRAIEEVKELETGYAFRLRTDGISLVELGEWAGYERKCCPFFDFEIAVTREDGPVWLTLRGREGAKAFMRIEFKELRGQ